MVYWFIGRLYFVWRFSAAVHRTSKKYRWRRCSRQHVRIFNLICSNGLRSSLKVLKSYDKRIRNLYDINIFVQIILSLIALHSTNYLNYNFNSLIYFRIIVGYSICTDYSKFGLILVLSKIRFGNKPISIDQTGVDILCQV